MRASSRILSVRTPLLVLALCEVFVLYSALFVAAYLVQGSIDGPQISLQMFDVRSLIAAIVIFLGHISVGLYQFHQRAYLNEVLARLSVSVLTGSLILAALFALVPGLGVPFTVGGVAIIFVMIVLAALRYIFNHSVDENRYRRRTLIYGAGTRSSGIADLRRKADRRGFKIVGAIPAPGDTINDRLDLLAIKDKSIKTIATDLDVDEVVIAMDDRRGNLPIRELLDCRMAGIEVIDLLEFLERESGKIRADLVNPGWLIFSRGFHRDRFRSLVKRAIDIAVSSVLLLVGWPVMLLVAICIKVEDGLSAPLIYRQSRVGYLGQPFAVLKFRSMRENAEANGAVWAEEDDPRVTRVGKYLRKFRLDELPQVLNVFRGQMSLVGPRPERPEFVETLSASIPYYAERHCVKPGVTGWAQLRYPYGASEEDAMEKLHYDLYYVKNYGLILDLMIILQTVEVVIWGKGAR